MLTVEQKVTFLKEISLFKDGSDEDLMGVASITQEVHFHGDEDIFLEGDSGYDIYLIVHGQVMISTMGKQIALRMDNEFFGEMAIIDDRPRSATATSRRDSVLLRIERDEFYLVMQNNIGFMRNLLKALVNRLREDINQAVEAASIKRELMMAHELQVNILPSSDLNQTSSNGSSIQVSGVCYPAESVGGDYYDYFRLSDLRIGIAIGDVMGHGFHSGVLVFATKSCLQTQIMSSYDIPDVMSVLNNMVCRFVLSSMFMTFCYLIVDLDAHTISYCNAGHNYPYHYRHDLGRLDCLESDTYFMGIDEKLDCRTNIIKWGDGDILVLYTDGITETLNSQDEQFGKERLERLISSNTNLSAPELKSLIIQELNKYCEDNVYKDDVTLVIAKMGY